MSKNLTITHESTFNGNKVYIDKEGLVVEYLEGIESVLENALEQYARLFIVRVDLNLPTDFRGDDSAVMTRFFRSLKSQVAAYRRRSARLNRKPYRETTIRYVWAKECDTSTSSHYHVALIFDRNIFALWGILESISKVWLTVFVMHGSVQWKPCTQVKRNQLSISPNKVSITCYGTQRSLGGVSICLLSTELSSETKNEAFWKAYE